MYCTVEDGRCSQRLGVLLLVVVVMIQKANISTSTTINQEALGQKEKIKFFCWYFYWHLKHIRH
jgi:hypothetical protein